MINKICDSIQNYEGLSVKIVKPALYRLWSKGSVGNELLFRVVCLGAAIVGIAETIVAFALTFFTGIATLICLCKSKNLNRLFFEIGTFSSRSAEFVPYLLISGLIHHQVASYFHSM